MARHIFAAVFGALLVILPVRQALRADTALYTVEDLGLIDNLVPTVTGMNGSGQLTGYVPGGDFGLPQAVIYTDGSWQRISGVGTYYSLATGINDAGDVVGYSHTDAGFRAFRYVPGLGVTFIDPLPGGTMSLGRAIDAEGNIYGQSDSADGNSAFRAAPGLPAVALATPGFTGTTACGVNGAGQVVGYGLTETGSQHAFRLEADGSVTDIVPFDGPMGFGEACAIDAVGRVGGHTSSGDTLRAFTFESGAPVNADTFGAVSTQSNVESVAGGVAVGWFALADGSFRAILNAAGASFDLNDLVAPDTGWQLDRAFAVTVNGSIAGSGRLNGEPRAFRLTRVEASDTTAPVITGIAASPSSIARPNDSLVTVTLSVNVTDDRDPSPVCAVTGIDGHGAPAADYTVTGQLSGSVRARSGASYAFAVSCADAAGNASTGSVDVVVHRDTTAPVIASLAANPSMVRPADGSLVPVAVSVSASDDVDQAPSCKLESISATGGSAGDRPITGLLTAKVRAVEGRTYTLLVACVDKAGNRASAAVAVAVPRDTTGPVITRVVATPHSIWPANNRMVPVTVSISATDDSGIAPKCALIWVESNGRDGDHDTDVTGRYTAQVRAERNLHGAPRTYLLKVACADGAYNITWGSTTVVVSRDGQADETTRRTLSARIAAKRYLVKKFLEKAFDRYLSRGSSR